MRDYETKGGDEVKRGTGRVEDHQMEKQKKRRVQWYFWNNQKSKRSLRMKIDETWYWRGDLDRMEGFLNFSCNWNIIVFILLIPTSSDIIREDHHPFFPTLIVIITIRNLLFKNILLFQIPFSGKFWYEHHPSRHPFIHASYHHHHDPIRREKKRDDKILHVQATLFFFLLHMMSKKSAGGWWSHENIRWKERKSLGRKKEWNPSSNILKDFRTAHRMIRNPLVSQLFLLRKWREIPQDMSFFKKDQIRNGRRSITIDSLSWSELPSLFSVIERLTDWIRTGEV